MLWNLTRPPASVITAVNFGDLSRDVTRCLGSLTRFVLATTVGLVIGYAGLIFGIVALSYLFQ